MEKIFCSGQTKVIHEGEQSLIAWASKEVLDRDGEIIEAAGIDLTAYQKNPVLMWAHQGHLPPIGKVIWTKKSKDEKHVAGLLFKAQFAKTPFAQEIYQLFKDGILKMFSVGFMAIDSVDGKDAGANKIFKAVELLEISAVPVGANQEALLHEVKSGRIQTKELKDLIAEEKFSITFVEDPNIISFDPRMVKDALSEMIDLKLAELKGAVL